MTAEGHTPDGVPAPCENTALFGHDAAQAFLAGAYRRQRVHHAILMEGSQGIGKATLAFRFANHVLSHPDAPCAPDAIQAPDPAAPLFRQIAGGACHHLVHLRRPADEKTGRLKSAITVDEVRRIGRFFSQTSGTGNWRIAIVDSADDLNRAAANALLKILEEPPRRSLFLLLSHAPGKLLPTIRSRCLSLRLHPLDAGAMKAALGHLGLSQADGGRQSLDQLVARADGSVAQALTILRYGGLDIADAFDDIVGKGRAARPQVHALADALTARDRETAFVFFQTYLRDWIMEQARRAARKGDLAAADRFARLAAETEETWTTASAYNLDRKQTILSVFSSVLGIAAA